jgi:MYXO-CTERM domain-containing protein
MRLFSCSLLVACLLAPVARAQTVRTDRPRLLLSNGAGFGTSAAEFRRRCTTDAAYSARCQGSITSADDGLYPAIAHAAGYVVNDDAAQCGLAYDAALAGAAAEPGTPDAHSFISDHGRTMLQLAVTLDWCWPALSSAQRDALIAKIAAYADWYVANGAPDVFHNDMFNVWNAVALAGLALSGSSADAQAAGYIAAAAAQWADVILPALRYAGDWWHEGMTYVQPSLGSVAWYATAWSTATDRNVFAADPALFEGYLRFHAYAVRPDWRYATFGDTSDNKQSIELFSRWLVDALTAGTGSTLGQALSMEIREHSRPWYDYAGADGWMQALFYDATRDGAATPLSELPTAARLSPDVQDIAVLRSGWGPDDTYVWISCGDYMSAHQHDEAGSFQIFRRALLTGPSGAYDAYNSDHWQNYYSQHSVHANTLAVVQPGEFFPTLQSLADAAANVNDGGQRVLGLDRSGSTHQVPDLAAYRAKKDGGPLYETGRVETFEHAACYDYVACDVTAAYDSPGFTTNGNSAKVNEVSRQFVFLPPDMLLVFDRVEATDPSYVKRFLLHVIGTADLGTDRYQITNGTAVLLARTLVPEAATVDAVDGFEVAGRPHAPASTGAESGGLRLEISPPIPAARDYFLHLFRATDVSDRAWPEVVVTDSASQVQAVITLGSRSYTIALRKGDRIGGHFTSRDSATGSGCDQFLGWTPIPTDEGGEPLLDGSEPPPDGGGDARPDSATDTPAGDTLDSGIDGGPSPPGDDGGGCGCRTTNAPPLAPLGLALLALLGLGLVRRRS